MELNQRERLVENHLMSLLGREPGGTPCPPRPLLFQLGALDSARLSCPVSVDSLHRGGEPSPNATRPRCSWGPAPYADLVAESGSGSGSAPRLTPHFPLRPAWEVSFPFCWLPAGRSASGVSNFLGWSGVAAPPPHRHTAPEGLKPPGSLRELLSAPPARVGGGVVAQGPRRRQGLFSLPCASPKLPDRFAPSPEEKRVRSGGKRPQCPLFTDLGMAGGSGERWTEMLSLAVGTRY